jgi:hypothetical protein
LTVQNRQRKLPNKGTGKENTASLKTKSPEASILIAARIAGFITSAALQGVGHDEYYLFVR